MDVGTLSVVISLGVTFAEAKAWFSNTEQQEAAQTAERFSMSWGEGAAVTGAATEHRGGPCLDRLRVTTFNANGLFTVTPGP